MMLQSEKDRLIEMAREEVPVRRYMLLRSTRKLNAARRQRDRARQELANFKAAQGLINVLGVLRLQEEKEHLVQRLMLKEADMVALRSLRTRRSWWNRMRDRLGLWR